MCEIGEERTLKESIMGKVILMPAIVGMAIWVYQEAIVKNNFQMGWFFIIFFGLMFVIALAKSVGRSTLVLTSEWFEISSRAGKTRERWDEVGPFDCPPPSSHAIKDVHYTRLKDKQKRVLGVKFEEKRVLPSVVEMNPYDLAGLMNAYRKHYFENNQ